MKFKATDTLNVRSAPSVTATVINKISGGSMVESDEYTWKKVTLTDGTQGYCAAQYLQMVTGATATKNPTFKATDTLNVRSAPSVTATVINKISGGSMVESDEYTWKKVTLTDGTQGYCAAQYLQMVAGATANPTTPQKWYCPIRADKFVVTQKFLAPDAVTYPKTGHHPGVDYGTNGDTNIPLFFCTDGEVIESGAQKSYGNYFFFYAPSVDRTFVYFHLRDAAPQKGQYKGGTQCGITGQTGLSYGVHLHLECLRGKKNSIDRSQLFTSLSAVQAASEDADAFLRARINT